MKKGAFFVALVLTIIIFIVGLLLGFYLESWRQSDLETVLSNSEVNLLDEQLRGEISQKFDINCRIAVSNTFAFADRIYAESLSLEEYDTASKFQNQLKSLHKRYDILRTILWLQSIDLKKKCPGEFHTIVYLYEYNTDIVKTKALQIAISKQLEELKNKYPGDVLLIPIAGNMNVDSINLIKENENIHNLPVIIVDENTKISELLEMKELENVVFNYNKQ
jgi:hypothetical protein